MTQAQIDLQKQAQVDLQNQLEQATADLTTRPLLNDSPVLYIETSEQTPPNFLEQMENTKVEHENPKTATPHDDTDHTQATPPPPKKTIRNHERSSLSFFTTLSFFNTFKNFTLYESCRSFDPTSFSWRFRL